MLRQPADITGPVSDPLIDEVRSIRREMSERFGNDVEKLAEHLRRVGESYRRDQAPPADSESRVPR
jgi:hypothetical protein